MTTPALQSETDALFFRSDLTPESAKSLVGDALTGADDGELYLEHKTSEMLSFDDGRLRSAAADTHRGFGLRAVSGDVVGYAHGTDISTAGLKRAGDVVRAVAAGHGGQWHDAPNRTQHALYPADDPIALKPFGEKVTLMQAIDAYARGLDPRVVQVSISLALSWQAVQILRPDGWRAADIRPLTRLNVSIITDVDGRRESGSYGFGERGDLGSVFEEGKWRAAVDEALRQSLVNQDSIPTPAGEMPVVLGPGWPGVMLHEAVGHGLEGDFNRKKTSAFAGLMGEQVASRGVTVVDDGTIEGRRGSLSVDDEGTPTNRTVLIEDGRLVGYMQDRQNARLMGVRPTGNGRRESFSSVIMPRMTRRRSSRASIAESTRSISAAARWTSPPASSSSP